MALLWLILKRYTILEDSFLSLRYRDDVMTTLNFDWSNLKILMSDWHRKLTSSCVSFTIYYQCHTDIEGDVTPISLQYQNVHWVYYRRSNKRFKADLRLANSLENVFFQFSFEANEMLCLLNKFSLFNN